MRLIVKTFNFLLVCLFLPFNLSAANVSDFTIRGFKLGEDITKSIDEFTEQNREITFSKKSGEFETDFFKSDEITFSFESKDESDHTKSDLIFLKIAPSQISKNKISAISYTNSFFENKHPMIEDVSRSFVEKYGTPDASMKWNGTFWYLWATKTVSSKATKNENDALGFHAKLTFFQNVSSGPYFDGHWLSRPIAEYANEHVLSMGKFLACTITAKTETKYRDVADRFTCLLVDGNDQKDSVNYINKLLKEGNVKSKEQDVANRKNKDIKL